MTNGKGYIFEYGNVTTYKMNNGFVQYQSANGRKGIADGVVTSDDDIKVEEGEELADETRTSFTTLDGKVLGKDMSEFTAKATYYSYSIADYVGENENVVNLLYGDDTIGVNYGSGIWKGGYYLASSYAIPNVGRVGYGYFSVKSTGSIGSQYMYGTFGEESKVGPGIRPVVYIDPNANVSEEGVLSYPEK